MRDKDLSTSSRAKCRPWVDVGFGVQGTEMSRGADFIHRLVRPVCLVCGLRTVRERLPGERLGSLAPRPEV